jgi:hypothetical protein
MESRKAWRNREPSAGQGVMALLEALREGLGAQGVGLFDDDRGDPSGLRSPPSFWDAFEQAPCAEIDWAAFYQELRQHDRVETTCGCGGAHHLFGFLLHGRWALLLVAPPTLPSGAAAVIASAVGALAARLPPGKDADGGEGAREATPAPAGGPLWWVSKARH